MDNLNKLKIKALPSSILTPNHQIFNSEIILMIRKKLKLTLSSLKYSEKRNINTNYKFNKISPPPSSSRGTSTLTSTYSI